MFYILTILAIIAIISVSIYLFNEPNYKLVNTVMALIISAMIGGALILCPIGSSYSSYLSIKATYYGVVTQYKDAIDIYEDKAVINVDKISFTDLKYQGYQKEIVDLIKDLRSVVSTYNRVYIKKKTMKNNLMFSWVIIAPDSGMKLLQMTKEADKHKIMLLMPRVEPGERL